MNAREAARLKIGDYVIGPKFGVIKPMAVDRIVTKEADPRAIGNLPLIGFEDSPDLYTYLGLMRVVITRTHVHTKNVEELHLTRDIIVDIASYNGMLSIAQVFKFLKEGKAVYTNFHKYEIRS